MAKLGFVGLGIMGTPMAGHLIAAGHEVFLNTLGQVPKELIDAGGKACVTAADVTAEADTIFIMVPDTPQVDIDFVAAIREAVGSEIRLMVDANCAYSENFKTALEVGRALQDLGIYWFEEPIAPNDLEGYKRLSSALDIRIAAGEADFMAFGSRDFFRSGAIDVVQPNISRTGGITEARRIAAMSRAFHIPYAPHTGSCSAVCLAATLQFAVSLPNFLIFEFMQSDWSKTQPNPLRHDLLKEPVEKLEDGHMVVPEGPGIGIEINMDVVDNYRMA